MLLIIVILLLTILFITAVYAIFSKSIVNSIISLSILSINTTVIFILLKAPDVAVTEAVIGAGIMTAFFIITVNKTEER